MLHGIVRTCNSHTGTLHKYIYYIGAIKRFLVLEVIELRIFRIRRIGTLGFSSIQTWLNDCIYEAQAKCLYRRCTCSEGLGKRLRTSAYWSIQFAEPSQVITFLDSVTYSAPQTTAKPRKNVIYNVEERMNRGK